MTKVLVSGCSISAGSGFPLEKSEPRLWCNQVAEKLNANLTNVSVPGYDNPGIFLNALERFTEENYDLILIQFSGFDRIVVSPNIHGRILISSIHHLSNIDRWKDWFDKKDYQNFVKTFVLLNRGMEHWCRLINIILSLQNLRKKLNLNIRFINGLLPWDRPLFDGGHSDFLWNCFDLDKLPDHDIKRFTEQIHKQIQFIDLDLWINPFDSFASHVLDRAPLDDHAGYKSHDLYTDIVMNSL